MKVLIERPRPPHGWRAAARAQAEIARMCDGDLEDPARDALTLGEVIGIYAGMVGA